MTYDAVLVARRGLGVEELERASPDFIAAVRWAAFAERFGAELGEMRAGATQTVPAGMTGQAVIDFQARRNALKAYVAEVDDVLYPADEDDDGD